MFVPFTSKQWPGHTVVQKFTTEYPITGIARHSYQPFHLSPSPKKYVRLVIMLVDPTDSMSPAERRIIADCASESVDG